MISGTIVDIFSGEVKSVRRHFFNSDKWSVDLGIASWEKLGTMSDEYYDEDGEWYLSDVFLLHDIFEIINFDAFLPGSGVVPA